MPMPTLKRGDRGNDVKRVQRILCIREDGDFGEHTELAVKVFKTTFLDAAPTEPGIVTPALWVEILKHEKAEA